MNRGWALGIALNIVGVLALLSPAVAQTVREDNTLGGENSRVTRNVQIRGRTSDRIEGGARRGQNLFHSFEQFDVQEGRGAYFLNPDGVQNIFSRVTGNTVSNINGTLGVIQADNQTLGTANLFFMNPNGILFGAGSSLDLGGSFVGTTANAIGFGDRGIFSATSPGEPSSLLTVNPSAFLFNQVPAPITNRSRSERSGRDPSNSFDPYGLRVPDGQSLLLLGGDINIDNGGLVAFGGQIELGSLGGAGSVGVRFGTARLDLDFPTTVPRNNVALTNNSGLIVAAGGGGKIGITARNVDILQGSSIQAGILGRLGSPASQAGDITINAQGTVLISGSGSIAENDVNTDAIGNSGSININAESFLLNNGGVLSTTGLGQGNSGEIRIHANGSVVIEDGESDSYIRSNVGTGAIGSSGGINISSSSLRIADGAQIFANTRGQGNSGQIVVKALNLVSLEGTRDESPSGIFSSVQNQAIGNSGGINITTDSLQINNGAQMQASVFGRGDSGQIRIIARNSVSLDGRDRNDSSVPSAIFTRVYQGATGAVEGTQSNTGGIHIRTGSLSLTNRSQLASTTEGRGNPGDIIIEAQNRVFLLNSIIISEVSEQSGIGDAGNIYVTTGTLELRDGSSLLADTEYLGDAGSIKIVAHDSVILDGRGPSANRLDVIVPSQITSTVDFVDLSESALSGESIGVGDGGDITITTNSFSIANDGFISTRTFGEGDAGDIYLLAEKASIKSGGLISSSTFGNGNSGNLTVRASEINLSGISNEDQSSSSLEAAVNDGATGNGGRLTIAADQLTLSDDAVVSTSTFAQGNAGNMVISVGDISLMGGSVITSRVGDEAQGNGGDIDLQADLLSLTNGSQINAFITRQQLDAQGNITAGGQGRGGDLRINVSDSISLSGVNQNGFSSGLFTLTERGALGAAGDIYVTTGNLRIVNGGIIVASTYNSSAGGSISINAENLAALRGGQIVTSTRDSGNAGRIQLNITGRLALFGFDPNFADRQERVRQYIPTTEGQFLEVSDIINSEGANSGIFANTTSTSSGRGGTITLGANTLSLSNRASITASTSGQGNAGNISLQIPNLVLRDRSQISTATNGVGHAGNIVSNSDIISLSNSIISTEVGETATVPIALRNRLGNININTQLLNLRNNGQISASTNGQGGAGNVSIHASQAILMEGDSSISSAVRHNGRGRGGNVDLATDALLIDGSRINASTIGQGRAGNITITADTLDATNAGQLTTSTRSDRPAGTINLTARDLNLNNNAAISSDSQGAGQAGNIRVRATGTLNANNSNINTSATQSAGGTIDIVGRNINLFGSSNIQTNVDNGSRAGGTITVTANDIRLRNDSDIQTAVRRGTGGGGDIVVNADSIVAYDDSDFISSAPNRGGDITLNTSAFFGESYQPDAELDGNGDNNDRVDLNANGRVSSGTIRTPNTDTIQNSLSDLPTGSIDSDRLIANSCIARTREGGTFLVTGSGGLADRPGNAASSAYPTGEVRAVPIETETWQPGGAIVEPQGVYQLPDGRIVMSRECSE